MSIVFVALGSNVGDKKANILSAIKEISGGCKILAKSSIYETKPMYVTDQPDFVNSVIKIETSKQPLELLDFLQTIEKTLGRDRVKEVRFGPRIIDLDLLIYDDLKISSGKLILPHPRMHERAFVLVPLYEICKDSWVKKNLDRLSKGDKDNVIKM